jgi:hypothetical protein
MQTFFTFQSFKKYPAGQELLVFAREAESFHLLEVSLLTRRQKHLLPNVFLLTSLEQPFVEAIGRLILVRFYLFSSRKSRDYHTKKLSLALSSKEIF